MEVLISNEKIQAKINTLGAELVSLVDINKNRELMWQKNPKFWNKCSPVLFPFIGAIKENQYFYNNKKYNFNKKHGFAREKEFKIILHTDNQVEMLLSYDEETLKIYPFKFKFYMKYIVKNNILQIEYKVVNLEDKELFFSLGAHPAFNTPLGENLTFSDYYILFENSESEEGYTLIDSLFCPENKKLYLEKDTLILDNEIFKNDIIIFKNINSKKLYLKNKKTNFTLGFKFDGFKHIGFWKKLNAEYICIEPWNGLPDYKLHNGKLEDKKYIEVLNPKEIYEKNIEIEIL